MKKEEMTKAMLIDELAKYDIKANAKQKKDELIVLLTEAEEAETESATEETEEEATETAEAEKKEEKKQKRAQKMTLKEMFAELAFIKEYDDRIEFKVLKTNDIAVKLNNKRIFRYIASSQLLSTGRIEYMSDVNDDVKIIKTATKTKARCNATRENMIQILSTAEVFS